MSTAINGSNNYAVTVSIAAHYNPARISFLAETLRAMFDWRVRQLFIRVVTNDPILAHQGPIIELTAAAAQRGISMNVTLVTDLDHPYLLTWVHKDHIRDWLASDGHNDGLFIYIEDDIVISPDNIDYFVHHLSATKKVGGIPGFVRYEKTHDMGPVAVDFQLPQITNSREHIKINETTFISPLYPYWAGFILDRELAFEYIESASCDIERSANIRQVRKNTVRVRSAMGLCFENIPSRRACRYLLPIRDGRLDPQCLVWHCAQNYSTMRHENFARIPIRNIFVRRNSAGLAYWLFNWLRIRSDRWHTRFKLFFDRGLC
jgi:hypothetical protein